MTDQDTATTQPKGTTTRSILAILVGFFVNIALTLPTDVACQHLGLLPALGQAMNDQNSAIATAYRTIFSIFSSWVVARLAPHSPMAHALLGAGIGMALALVGAIVTWNHALGPHWYPLALVVLALPTGWLGGKLRLMQLEKKSA